MILRSISIAALAVMLLAGCSQIETLDVGPLEASKSPEASPELSTDKFIDSSDWTCESYWESDPAYGQCRVATYEGAGQGGSSSVTVKPYALMSFVCQEGGVSPTLFFVAGDSLKDATKYKWSPGRFPDLEYSVDYGPRLKAPYGIQYPSGAKNPEQIFLDPNNEFETAVLGARTLEMWVTDYQGSVRELSFVIEGMEDATTTLDDWGFPCSFGGQE
jgi:hypothetical protein